jgi:mono/diheme cytochrome c family protein
MTSRLKRRLAMSVIAFCSVSVVMSGCSSAKRDEPTTPPLNIANERLSTGQQVFMEHCYQCHPGGAGGLAPAINDKPLPVWLMKTQVRAGLGAMPSFSKQKIDDQQLDALMVYLKALRATSG